MKLYPQFINGRMMLMTECGQIVENMTVISIQSDAKASVTHFTAAFIATPTPKEDQN